MCSIASRIKQNIDSTIRDRQARAEERVYYDDLLKKEHDEVIEFINESLSSIDVRIKSYQTQACKETEDPSYFKQTEGHMILNTSTLMEIDTYTITIVALLPNNIRKQHVYFLVPVGFLFQCTSYGNTHYFGTAITQKQEEKKLANFILEVKEEYEAIVEWPVTS